MQFPRLEHRYRVFVVCAGGIFITVFDTSSAIVALPTIALDFSTVLPTAQWVIIGNSLTIAALLVPMGRLSDLIGRKRIYVVGCLLFAIGSLFAAFAGSMAGLITARVVVGVGSAMTQGTAMAILVGNFDLNERARMLGLQMGGVGLGAMAGPAIGGIIVGAVGWHMLFALTGIAMFAIAVAAQRELKRRKKRPDVAESAFDYGGAALFSCMFAAGLLTLTLGPRMGWFEWPSIAGAALFVALLFWFIALEKRHASPMLDFAMFRNAAFALGALGAVVAFMAISATRFLTPFILQGIKGLEPTRVGLVMLPAATVTALAAPFAGRFADRHGVRLFANIGFGITVLGVAMFALLDVRSTVVLVVAALMVMALGMSVFAAANSASILNSVASDAHGVAAGFVNLCRNTGNIIGIAFGTAVVSLAMSIAGFVPSFEEVTAASDEQVALAFMGGVRAACIALIALALPVLAIIVAWSVRAARGR
jgi:EmrB/QacA subfamily drug resistance transporter